MSNFPGGVSQSQNTSSEAAKAVVRRNTVEVQGRGNFEVFEELFAMDFVDRTPQPGRTADRNGAPELYHVLRAAFPDFHAEIHWQAADGDLVTTYKTYHGTHQGTFLGVAPTGRKIHFETVDAMRVRNGQITEHWGVANAPFEKCFDRGKLFDDHGAQLTLMRRDLKRAIDEEAPFALSVIDRVVNDLSKELNDRLFGRQRRTLLNDVSAIG